MKNWTLSLLCLSSFSCALEPEMIEDYKAVFYVNQSVMVCGNVAQVKTAEKMTYLNLGGVYPQQKIALLIWKDEQAPFITKFGSLSSLTNKRLCAYGSISEYKGRLQMKMKDPNFLRLMK